MILIQTILQFIIKTNTMKNLKKLLLVLLLSFTGLQATAQTKTELLALVNTLTSGTPNTAAKMRTILTAIVEGTYQTGDILIVDCTNQYITDNFDGTGLGINLRDGWAICNGNNGTRNWAGRVPLAYGTGYTTMGASLGDKDAVVVEHSHSITYGSSGVDTSTQVSRDSDGNTLIGTTNTNSTGVDGTDKNIQPSIVTLVLMKL